MSPTPRRQAMINCPHCGAQNDPARGSKLCVSCNLPLDGSGAELEQHERVIGNGLDQFIETARALIDAETRLDSAAFDTFCRVHVGASAAEVRTILDLVRGSL